MYIPPRLLASQKGLGIIVIWCLHVHSWLLLYLPVNLNASSTLNNIPIALMINKKEKKKGNEKPDRVSSYQLGTKATSSACAHACACTYLCPCCDCDEITSHVEDHSSCP